MWPRDRPIIEINDLRERAEASEAKSENLKAALMAATSRTSELDADCDVLQVRARLLLT